MGNSSEPSYSREREREREKERERRKLKLKNTKRNSSQNFKKKLIDCIIERISYSFC